jgi:hypothetical protein
MPTTWRILKSYLHKFNQKLYTSEGKNAVTGTSGIYKNEFVGCIFEK